MKTGSFMNNAVLYAVAAAALALATTACNVSGSSSSSSAAPATSTSTTSTSTTISGTLSAAGSGGGSSMSERDQRALFEARLSQFSSSLDGYSVTCQTLTSPPVLQTADVAADGSFSLTLAAQGDFASCVVNVPVLAGASNPVAIAVPAAVTGTAISTTSTVQIGTVSSASLGTVSFDSSTGIAATASVTGITPLPATQSLPAAVRAAVPCMVGNWVGGSVNYVGGCESGTTPDPVATIQGCAKAAGYGYNGCIVSVSNGVTTYTTGGLTSAVCASNPTSTSDKCTCAYTDGSYCTMTGGAGQSGNQWGPCLVQVAGVVGPSGGSAAGTISIFGSEGNYEVSPQASAAACAWNGQFVQNVVATALENPDGTFTATATVFDSGVTETTCGNQTLVGAQMSVPDANGNLSMVAYSQASDVDLSGQFANTIPWCLNSNGGSEQCSGSNVASGSSCTGGSSGTCSGLLAGNPGEQAACTVSYSNASFNNNTNTGSITITGFDCVSGTLSQTGVFTASSPAHYYGLCGTSGCNGTNPATSGTATYTITAGTSVQTTWTSGSTLPSTCTATSLWTNTMQAAVSGCSTASPTLTFMGEGQSNTDSGCAICIASGSSYPGGGDSGNGGCMGCGSVSCTQTYAGASRAITLTRQ